jgi:hypothetical protein
MADQTDPATSLNPLNAFTPLDPADVPKPEELDELAQAIQAHHKAVQEEFELISSENPEALREHGRKKFAEAYSKAINRVISLIDHAEKDTTALQAARFVIQEVHAAASDEDSPLNTLIKELTATQ